MKYESDVPDPDYEWLLKKIVKESDPEYQNRKSKKSKPVTKSKNTK